MNELLISIIIINAGDKIQASKESIGNWLLNSQDFILDLFFCSQQLLISTQISEQFYDESYFI